MAITELDNLDIDLFTHLDNFVEYSCVKSMPQHGFIYVKNNRKLYLYINCKTGIHSAHLEIDKDIVSVLSYYSRGHIMVYDQSIYFEHEREGCSEKKIEIDTENISINVSLLNNLSPATKDWLDASPEKLKSQTFRLLKDGIACTSEANRGKNIFYKCLFCETMILSVPKDSVACKCGAITIDVDMVRLCVKNLSKIQILEKII